VAWRNENGIGSRRLWLGWLSWPVINQRIRHLVAAMAASSLARRRLIINLNDGYSAAGWLARLSA